MKKTKLLIIITFTLISATTFGTNKNNSTDYNKENNISTKIITLDNISQSNNQKEIDSTATNNIKKNKKQISELNIGYFSEGGANLFYTSWIQNKPLFSFGLGIGLRHYFQEELTVFPVYIDLKTNLSTNKVTPFLSCKIGYSLRARMFFNPKIGLAIKTSSKNALNIGVGYEMQQIGTAHFGKSVDNSIGVNIGYQF